LKITPDELSEVHLFITRQHLQPIRKERLLELTQAGMVLVGCGDCDQFKDIFWAKTEFTDRIQPLTSNGGPLLIVEKIPSLRKPGVIRDYKEQYLDQIYDAMLMKGIKTIVLISHTPCGVARHLKLTTGQVLKDTLIAREVIREELGLLNENILTLFHVDFGGSQKETYVIKKGLNRTI
jgi:hypothetical protein